MGWIRVEDINNQLIEAFEFEEEVSYNKVFEKIFSNIKLEDTVCLRFIDSYMDTMFNQLQLPIFVQELEEAVSKTTNKEAKEQGLKLLLFAKKHIAQLDHYLKFYGD